MSNDPLLDSVLLLEIHPVNLLSFGPKTKALALGPLNVFIGPNGSGKSNLIETVALMRASRMFAARCAAAGGPWTGSGRETSQSPQGVGS